MLKVTLSLVCGFTENGQRWNIAQLWKLYLYISGGILKISFWNCVSSLLRMQYVSFYFYRSSRFSQKPEPLIHLKNWYRQVDFSSCNCFFSASHSSFLTLFCALKKKLILYWNLNNIPNFWNMSKIWKFEINHATSP